jgi:hypothetical protein
MGLKILFFALGTLGLVLLLLRLKTRTARLRFESVRESLGRRNGGDPGLFLPDRYPSLPEPVMRFFRHALQPETPACAAVRLTAHGRMKTDPGTPYIELACREVLAPGRGFAWEARARMKGLPVLVQDHYFENSGRMWIAAAGLLPLIDAGDAGITRSARGRLAFEALWCPSALLPGAANPYCRWEAPADDRIRLFQTIDGEELSLDLVIDSEGRVLEVLGERYGNSGRPDYGFTPYGFRVLEEKRFAGTTIAARLSGGWWYGSERFVESDASEFHVETAEFF